MVPRSGGNGGALRQALLSQAYPSQIVNWGGQTLTINALLLDISGILFAVQAVFLLMVSHPIIFLLTLRSVPLPTMVTGGPISSLGLREFCGLCNLRL